MKLPFKSLMCGIPFAAMLFAAPQANAVAYGFTRITSNSSQNVASQLSVDVTDGGAGFVDFKFTNNLGIASSICDIYFDDGTLLGISSITDSGSGVAFTDPANPGNLPGGNAVNFTTTGNFSADSDSPVSSNGVNTASEWVTIRFSLKNGKTYTDTISALQWGLDNPNSTADGLRIGLHVQAIGTDGDSDSYISGTPSPDPRSVPDGGTTLSLLGVAIFGAHLLRRRIGMS